MIRREAVPSFPLGPVFITQARPARTGVLFRAQRVGPRHFRMISLPIEGTNYPLTVKTGSVTRPPYLFDTPLCALARRTFTNP